MTISGGIRRLPILGLIALLAAMPAPAAAHRGRVGVYIGGPVVGAGLYYGAGWPYYRPWGVPYGYPYGGYYGGPYPPAVVTVPVAPPVYIEQSTPPAAPARVPAAFWYYCAEPAGYYPGVKECPPGWQAVPAQPAR